MFVADYATKFEELSRYGPCYNDVDVEGSKCVKFKNGMRPEIKLFIGYQEIHRFLVLVNKCGIYDKDSKARSTYYNSLGEKKIGNHNRCKPYTTPRGKGIQKDATMNEISWGLVVFSMRCFRYGRLGYFFAECKDETPTYFSFIEQGHLSRDFQNAQPKGKVFSLSGVEALKNRKADSRYVFPKW